VLADPPERIDVKFLSHFRDSNDPELGNDPDQKMADRRVGEDDAVRARHRARIQELKGKGYFELAAESQALR
jgi:hypothetical protein